MMETASKEKISKRHRNIVLIAVTAFLLLVFTRIYIAEPIEGWVIDAETKKPIEGVVVVASWKLYRGTIAGSSESGILNVLETTTDRDGRFFIPGWGPRVTWSGYLDWEDPELLMFKSGYHYRGLENPVHSYVNQSIARRSVWNGKKIELQKFKGSQKDYAAHLLGLNVSMDSIFHGGDCMWKKIPILVLAVDSLGKEFKRDNIYSPLYSIETLPSHHCESPEEFFQKTRK